MTITISPGLQTEPSEPADTMTLRVLGVWHLGFAEILTTEALQFVAELQERFGGRVAELLARRAALRSEPLGFRADTAHLRGDSGWRVAPPAPGLADRRCEIIGPPTRAMAARARSCGAQVWMADFEDALAPTWFNVIDGQRNLYDAVRVWTDPTDLAAATVDPGKSPTIMVRPRGWHLPEHHLSFEDQPVVGALVDFGLYFFHNTKVLIARGSGPYFYLPKLESSAEARLWRDVFAWSEQRIGIELGTIRATCMIETLPAAFQMTEILYELRDYSAGLNAGRWDYIFSVVKSFAADPDRVLPDRDKLSMTVPLMEAYTELLVRTCHERGAPAIGGVAAFAHGRDPQVSEHVLELTRQDKAREAAEGFDGSWVAHPDLVQTCAEAFGLHSYGDCRELPGEPDEHASAAALCDFTGISGGVSLIGLRKNIRAVLRYLTVWVQDRDATAADELMEDAATIEFSRMQIWQWIRHQARTDDGIEITRPVVAEMLTAETIRALHATNWAAQWTVEAAVDIFEHCCLGEDFPEFLTSYGYARYLSGSLAAGG